MRRKWLLKRHIRELASFTILFVLAFLFVSPLIWIFLTSLREVKEIYHVPLMILPRKIVLTHYQDILTQASGFIVYFANSVKVTLGTLIFVLFFSSLSGYAIGRRSFVGKTIVLSFVLLLLALPYIIYVIPIYIMEDNLGLIDTNLGLILPYVALNLPLSIFIMRGAFRTLPREFEDAARIDGCNEFQVWHKVLLPLVIPSLAAVAIITFVAVWEEFMFARTLMPSTHAQTLAVGIPTLKEEAKSWAYGTLSAALTLSILPVAGIFLVMQKSFVKGLLEGAIKK